MIYEEKTINNGSYTSNFIKIRSGIVTTVTGDTWTKLTYRITRK